VATSVGDMLLPVGVSAIAWMATIAWCFTAGQHDDRTWGDFIEDIRAMNQYNSYILAAIVIFLGFTQRPAGTPVPSAAVAMLLSAFTFGALSMFFFPIRKRTGGEGTSPPPGLPVRVYWVCDVLASQATIVFAVFGLWTLI
jgi:hypothetical protein